WISSTVRFLLTAINVTCCGIEAFTCRYRSANACLSTMAQRSQARSRSAERPLLSIKNDHLERGVCVRDRTGNPASERRRSRSERGVGRESPAAGNAQKNQREIRSDQTSSSE